MHGNATGMWLLEMAMNPYVLGGAASLILLGLFLLLRAIYRKFKK